MSRQKTRLVAYELAFGIAIAIQAFFVRTSRYTSALRPVKKFLQPKFPPELHSPACWRAWDYFGAPLLIPGYPLIDRMEIAFAIIAGFEFSLDLEVDNALVDLVGGWSAT
jgi:hypothetical protein